MMQTMAESELRATALRLTESYDVMNALLPTFGQPSYLEHCVMFARIWLQEHPEKLETPPADTGPTKQRYACADCGREVTHLISDERYGGCPHCDSFDTNPI